ncbi:unnamed protein product [Linum tenue]|uniref:RNase H type-1 domain-containing protein n=1 Tax=Linum tenue TaxID=586396 RepID=A0AAV0KBG8_9ROSI|nr:unnamed protein product [Linum tenue]
MFAGGCGLGVVARDSNEIFLLAAVKRIKGEHDPQIGEALAAEFGLQFARQHQLRVAVLETDCLSVVNCVRNAANDQTEFGVVCWSIHRLLEETGDGECKHVSRTANEAAHIMAHLDTNWNVSEVWFDRPPICLLNQLELDSVMVDHD